MNEFNFDAIWDSGAFRKFGKAEAKRRFTASVKTEKAWQDIQLARDAYNSYVMANKWYTPVLGSVWFGDRKGWRNWIPDLRQHVEALADDSPVHTHHCEMCPDAHDWLHEDPDCWLSRDVVCEAGLQAHKQRVAAMKGAK